MSITVEEIVAKVALRKQQQERQVYLRQLKQSMNEAMTKRADNLMIENAKKSSKAKNVTVRKDQPSKSTNNKTYIHSQTQSLIQPDKSSNQIPQLQLKYQRLKKQYNNLTKKVTHQLKLQQNYKQIQKKLQQVIKQNARLQKELDVIRMKRSKWEESMGCIESERMGKQTQRGMIKGKGSRVRDNCERMKSDKIVYREDSCGKCCEGYGDRNQRKMVQMKGCSKDKKQDSCDVNKPQNFSIYSQQKKAEEQVQMQIHHYTNAIQQKQHSITKLNEIISKQQRLLQYYSNLKQVATNNSSQLYVKNSKEQQKTTENQQKTAKNHQKPSQKGVQGTIVKIKRKQISNRNTFNGGNLNFYPEQKPSYCHQRQTRKKNEYFYPEKQLQQSTYTYRSPSRSVNQTSQFICD